MANIWRNIRAANPGETDGSAVAGIFDKIAASSWLLAWIRPLALSRWPLAYLRKYWRSGNPVRDGEAVETLG